MNGHQRYTRRELRTQDRQLEQEGLDWAYCAVSAAVIVTLVLLAVVGHAWVSAGM